MSTPPSPLAVEEYRALRATIRERGTLRLLVAAITFVAWSALVIAVQALFAVPALAMIPLLALVAGFEVVFAAHVGVERLGRFIEAVYETDEPDSPRWEHAAMKLSPGAGRGSGLDPLFTGLFLLATLFNLLPVALMTLETPETGGGFPLELIVFGVIHTLFGLRVLQARAFASKQRARDLEEFKRISPARS